jgi:hypothetical protein
MYILIITSSYDQTSTYIINKYFNKTNFFRLNIDKISNYIINIDGAGWTIIDENNNKLHNNEIKSIYYRKPVFPNLENYKPIYHSLIKKDILTLIKGLIETFPKTVLTKPSILEISENKVNQLIYASHYDIKIPKSYIGNSLSEYKKFCKFKSIIKPLSKAKITNDNSIEVFHTNYLRKCDVDISLTPIYLQEYIEKLFEVRIICINDAIYSVKIQCKNELDWRRDYINHEYEIIDCPDNIKNFCHNMLIHYSLKFGAFDFIVNKQGAWIFLELNPNGQWLWLELSLQLDISNQIYKLLNT